MTKIKEQAVATVAMPTGLKDLIALAESLGIKYTFQKKDALIELISKAQASLGAIPNNLPKEKSEKKVEAASSEPVELPEPDVKPSKSKEKIAKPVKEAKAPKKAVAKKAVAKKDKPKKENLVPEVDDVLDVVQDSEEHVVVSQEVADKIESSIAKAEPKKPTKPSKAKEPVVAERKPKANSLRTKEELELVAGVSEILKTATYTKSDKIRKLYQKCGLTVGEVAKVMGIIYSHSHCVIDAFKKLQTSSKDK